MFELLSPRKGYARWIFRRRLAILRGYRKLKGEQRLSYVQSLVHILSETPVVDSLPHHFVSGDRLELLLRRLLLQNLLDKRFREAVLVSIAKDEKLVYPLPASWIRKLSNSVAISTWKCAALWFAYVAMELLRGLRTVFREIYLAKREGDDSEAVSKPYVYFVGLPGNSLPDGRGNENVERWYRSVGGSEQIFHDCPSSSPATGLVYRRSPYAGSLSYSAYLKFLGAVTSEIFRVAGQIVMGKWWRAILLRGTVESLKVLALPAGHLADRYFFDISCWLTRPLWSYAVEEINGAPATLYFYATNVEVMKRGGEYPRQSGSWNLIDWSEYWVWDDYQSQFLQRMGVNSKQVREVGPINVFGEKWVAPPTRTKALRLAVFDVQPHREFAYRGLALFQEVYTASDATSFLWDICSVCEELGVEVVHKRKRDIGSALHPSYSACLVELDQSSVYVSVDSQLSARSVIHNSDLVVSMPFTSTAMIGAGAGKPSVFYDGLGKVDKDDRAAHGIKILSGKQELSAWLLDSLKSIQREPDND